jgi:hypothetical protein
MIDRRPFQGFQPDLLTGVTLHPELASVHGELRSPQESPPLDAAYADQMLRPAAGIFSIAFLLTISGISLFVAGGLLLLSVMSQPWMSLDVEPVAILLGSGLVLICIGSGLRQRSQLSRILAAVVAGAGLVQFPFGTAAGGFSLYLLFNTRAQRLFELSARGPGAVPWRVRRAWRRILGVTLFLLICTLLQVMVSRPWVPFLNR